MALNTSGISAQSDAYFAGRAAGGGGGGSSGTLFQPGAYDAYMAARKKKQNPTAPAAPAAAAPAAVAPPAFSLPAAPPTTTAPLPGGNAAAPRPMTPAPSRPPNASLPEDPVQATRGNKRPDRSLIDALDNPSRSGTSQAGSVLNAVYRLPGDQARAVRSLQQFNGPRGQATRLGV